MRNSNNVLIVLHYLTMIALVICITVAAIHFEKIGILWWYILPGLNGITLSSGGMNGGNK